MRVPCSNIFGQTDAVTHACHADIGCTGQHHSLDSACATCQLVYLQMVAGTLLAGVTSACLLSGLCMMQRSRQTYFA